MYSKKHLEYKYPNLAKKLCYPQLVLMCELLGGIQSNQFITWVAIRNSISCSCFLISNLFIIQLWTTCAISLHNWLSPWVMRKMNWSWGFKFANCGAVAVTLSNNRSRCSYAVHSIRKCSSVSITPGQSGQILSSRGRIGLQCRPSSIIKQWSDSLIFAMETLLFLFFIVSKYLS